MTERFFGENMRKTILFALVLLNAFYAFSADKMRFYLCGKLNGQYVDSEDGLNVRDEPSLSGKKIAKLLHNDYVIPVEIGEKTTIDGTEDFWVKILLYPEHRKDKKKDEYGWVFGGYLVKEQPRFDCSNWGSADVKRYLMSKEWKMVAWYDDWATVNFYENGTAKIKGSKTWTFNYQILSGKRIKISNISNTQIRSYTVQNPPKSEIYNQIYTLEFSDNLTVDTKETSALTLFYHFPADYPELFTRRELYETDDFEWHRGNSYDDKQFKNYFEFYVYEKKRFSEIKDSDIQNFIKCGLSPEGTGYETQYRDYWNPIIEAHQRFADEME